MSNKATGTTQGTIFTPEQEMFLAVGDDVFTAPDYLAGNGKSPHIGDILSLFVTTEPGRSYGRDGIKTIPGQVVADGYFEVVRILDVNQASIANEDNPFSNMPKQAREERVNGGTHYGVVLKPKELGEGEKAPKGLRTERASLIER